jgi:phosphoribosylanthranilate isomerase
MLGGSGRRFDWGLLGDREDRAEMVLAGGITAPDYTDGKFKREGYQ